MTFLLQIKKKTDGTVLQGTTPYVDEREALVQMFVAMSSAMSKDDTALITTVLTDEYGSFKKKETWEAPIVEVIEPVEETEEVPTEEEATEV